MLRILTELYQNIKNKSDLLDKLMTRLSKESTDLEDYRCCLCDQCHILFTVIHGREESMALMSVKKQDKLYSINYCIDVKC